MTISITIDGEELTLAFADEEHSEDGEATAEEVPNPVIPEINEMLWALGSFLALWGLMKFVLLPPLLKLRAEREAKVASDREAADRAHQALGEVQDEYNASLANARAEADGIIEAARSEAADYRSTVMAGATTEISEMRSDAASGLDDSRSAAIDSMKGDVGDIAVAAASAVLGKNLDRGAQQGAIDAALSGGDE